MEAKPVVTHAEAKLRWLDFLQTFDVTFPRCGESREQVQNPESDGLIQRPKLRSCLLAPDDPFSHVY